MKKHHYNYYRGATKKDVYYIPEPEFRHEYRHTEIKYMPVTSLLISQRYKGVWWKVTLMVIGQIVLLSVTIIIDLGWNLLIITGKVIRFISILALQKMAELGILFWQFVFDSILRPLISPILKILAIAAGVFIIYFLVKSGLWRNLYSQLEIIAQML